MVDRTGDSASSAVADTCEDSLNQPKRIILQLGGNNFNSFDNTIKTYLVSSGCSADGFDRNMHLPRLVLKL